MRNREEDAKNTGCRILVQVRPTIYRRLLIGRDCHLDQSEATICRNLYENADSEDCCGHLATDNAHSCTWPQKIKGSGVGVVVTSHACHVGACGFVLSSGIRISKKRNVSFPLTREDSVLWGAIRDREVACSVSDRKGSNFAPCCVWRATTIEHMVY